MNTNGKLYVHQHPPGDPMTYPTGKNRALIKAIFLACLILLVLTPYFYRVSCSEHHFQPNAESPPAVDFGKVAAQFPHLKTMVRIKFNRPLSLQLLAKLRKFGVLSHHGGPVEVLGEKQGVFFLRAVMLPSLMSSTLPIQVVPLDQFHMSGLYRIHFKVVDGQFTGRITFRISTPRDGFGKKLIYLEEHLSPEVNLEYEQDDAGNRWAVVSLDVTKKSRLLKLDFYFIYQVDLRELLEHALAMAPQTKQTEMALNSQASQMLQSGPKIDGESPRVASLANELFGKQEGGMSPRTKYRRILDFIKKNIPYDHQKRARFFGGKMVYASMAQMYNHPEVTLQKGFAACPSTSVLEAALLRAGGVPARTVGRWGHFYTELYQPGQGWLSTSVTPTGIPLVRDLDHQHLPFVSWNPQVAVQTTKWSGQVKVLE